MFHHGSLKQKRRRGRTLIGRGFSGSRVVETLTGPQKRDRHPTVPTGFQAGASKKTGYRGIGESRNRASGKSRFRASKVSRNVVSEASRNQGVIPTYAHLEASAFSIQSH